jgi:MarR family transcriptional regulator, lower aerobic nicotinate degradation pathway regulator
MARPKSAAQDTDHSDVDEDSPLGHLYRRPGFLIRRAHQIAVSIFLEEAAELGITTTQYGALVVLNTRNDLDQIGLSTLVGIDRSTTALVVGKLEAAGYIVRKGDPGDRRRKVLALTDAGRHILTRATEPARRTREREMAVFSADDQKTFLRLLETFVLAFNAETRAPIKVRAPVASIKSTSPD